MDATLRPPRRRPAPPRVFPSPRGNPSSAAAAAAPDNDLQSQQPASRPARALPWNAGGSLLLGHWPTELREGAEEPSRRWRVDEDPISRAVVGTKRDRLPNEQSPAIHGLNVRAIEYRLVEHGANDDLLGRRGQPPERIARRVPPDSGADPETNSRSASTPAPPTPQRIHGPQLYARKAAIQCGRSRLGGKRLASGCPGWLAGSFGSRRDAVWFRLDLVRRSVETDSTHLRC
jgi:hypothetical protein